MPQSASSPYPHENPAQQSEQHTAVQAEERTIGLTRQVPVKLQVLEKSDASNPDAPNKPLPEYRFKVIDLVNHCAASRASWLTQTRWCSAF
jgi:hypothetical protein